MPGAGFETLDPSNQTAADLRRKPRGHWDRRVVYIGKAVPLHAVEALGGRGGIAPTHSQPRH
jgi:hypothetical protein